MRRIWYIVLAALLVWHFVTVMSVLVLADSRPNLASELREILLPEDCATACWESIQPALTNRAAVQMLLDNNAIIFGVSTSTDEREAYVWQLDRNSLLVNPADTASVVVEFDEEDIVWRVALTTLDICFSRVLDAFGAPLLTGGDEYLLTMGYPREGLVFFVNLRTARVVALFVTTDAWVHYFSHRDSVLRWNRYRDRLTARCTDRLSSEESLAVEE